MQIHHVNNDVHIEGAGWKVFYQDKNEVLYSCTRHTNFRYYTPCKNGFATIFSRGFIQKSYKGPGFHVFTNLGDATRYWEYLEDKWEYLSWSPKEKFCVLPLILKVGIANYKIAQAEEGEIFLAEEMYVPKQNERVIDTATKIPEEAYTKEPNYVQSNNIVI